MAAGVLSGGVAGGKLRKPVSSLYMPIQQSGGCLFKPVYAYTTGWGRCYQLLTDGRSGGGWRHFFCVLSRGCGRYISGLPVSGY